MGGQQMVGRRAIVPNPVARTSGAADGLRVEHGHRALGDVVSEVEQFAVDLPWWGGLA